MTVAAAQASKFYEQVVKDGKVYTFDDGEGYLVFPVREAEVVPFWSSHSRMLKVQSMHEKYRLYKISEEPLEQFLDKTLQLLDEEGIRVGLNWSGTRLIGYDLSVSDLRRNLDYWIKKKIMDEQ